MESFQANKLPTDVEQKAPVIDAKQAGEIVAELEGQQAPELSQQLGSSATGSTVTIEAPQAKDLVSAGQPSQENTNN